MNRATWKRGKQTVTGSWEYHWASDSFMIVLDRRKHVIITKNETPEWETWKLVPSEKPTNGNEVR